ncbi:MAG: hypothetical protein COB02_16920 [Candidatus Cloacimonadota bacterium]|nr:MAG: hypothetical protein COB02_18410 [Candidatus Cloacimonadota bacterium]PCJ16120.1 MAG: hypothetical protein COB02_16920 [Candidatus Cloacimonadota bacterium]
MKPFELYIPDKIIHPLFISIPHCGTHIDENIKSKMTNNAKKLIDTDWILQDLYFFAKEMSIPMIYANYSRYQIDLNRPLPSQENLYKRKTSALVPTLDFTNQKIYTDYNPDKKEIQNRISQIYQPYYQQIDDLFDLVQKKFNKVLLFDAHSIRRSVKEISDVAFKDLMLGNRDGETCYKSLLLEGAKIFEAHNYKHSNNSPFKGGNITRTFYNKEKNRYSVQLEMSQDIYMESDDKFNSCKKMLKELLIKFSDIMKNESK